MGALRYALKALRSQELEDDMVVEQLLPWLGSFADQVVFVTGASSGIGRATALMFARQGASVALAARREAQLEQVADEIGDRSRALVVPMDVTDLRSARAAIRKVQHAWGRIDVLVNNAGVLRPSRVEQLTARDLTAMLRVNLFGALYLMQAVLPLMQRQPHGSIINVASLAGRRGVTPLGGYAASKFALVGLTEALRTEIDPHIHVGLVMPGVIDTPMAQGIEQDPQLAPWPPLLNMPADWVAAAVLIAVRFRLHEIAVPPGAATLEMLAGLMPSISDSLIRWGGDVARALAGGGMIGPAEKKKGRRRHR